MSASAATALRLGLALAFALAGAIAGVAPQRLAAHVRWFDGIAPAAQHAAAIATISALCVPFLAVACVAALRALAPARTGVQLALCLLGAAASVFALSGVLGDWWVDDAAITFAYSRNLADGAGIVLHPDLAPEEGYSSTSWMLLLAAVRVVGGSIDAASKLGGVLAGALAVALALHAAWRELGRRVELAPLLLVALTAGGAPLVIWSASGLEHGLQALLLTLAVTLPLWVARPIWPTALVLSALVLTRPEAPLHVAAIAGVYAASAFERGRPRRALVAWPIALVPAATLAALLAFRWSYFGDLMPNPYYVKGGSATLLRLFSPLGGGWGYVFDWLAASGAFVLLPMFAFAQWRAASRVFWLALAVVLAQLVFVVSFGGDWMGAFRFIAPALPALGIALARPLADLGARLSPARLVLLAGGAAALLSVQAAIQLARFAGAPTVSVADVARSGLAFSDLAQRLGIAHPRLAHHDLGGTSYVARIAVLDLGGLGNRTIAKHMSDAAFIRRYLFEENRPSFVFGRTDILAAASSRFHEAPEFAADYAPVEFADRPDVTAELCHVRRDLVRPAPGIEIIGTNGTIERVVVHALAPVGAGD